MRVSGGICDHDDVIRLPDRTLGPRRQALIRLVDDEPMLELLLGEPFEHAAPAAVAIESLRGALASQLRIDERARHVERGTEPRKTPAELLAERRERRAGTGGHNRNRRNGGDLRPAARHAANVRDGAPGQHQQRGHRMAHEQTLDGLSGQPRQMSIADRIDIRRTSLPGDERHLTDRLTRTEFPESRLDVVRASPNHPQSAADHDVDAVARITRAKQHLAAIE